MSQGIYVLQCTCYALYGEITGGDNHHSSVHNTLQHIDHLQQVLLDILHLNHRQHLQYIFPTFTKHVKRKFTTH